MKKITATFMAIEGLKEREISQCDSVALVLSDGRRFELDFRHSDGEISVSTTGQLVIQPRASNVVRINTIQ